VTLSTDPRLLYAASRVYEPLRTSTKYWVPY